MESAHPTKVSDPSMWRLLAAELEATRADAVRLEELAETAQTQQLAAEIALADAEQQLDAAQAQIDDLSAQLLTSRASVARLQTEHTAATAKLQLISSLVPGPVRALGRRALRIRKRLLQRASR